MKKIISILLICAFIVLPVAAEGEKAANSVSGELSARYITSVEAFIEQYYKFGATSDVLYKAALEKVLKENPDLLASAIEGMTEELDNYSTYFSKDEYAAWQDSLSGTFAGIGVTIEQRGEYIVVVSPISGSGAEVAGVKAGDKIISVGEEIVIGKSVEYIRALIVGDVGTEVTIGVLRGEDTISFTITRSIVEQPTISYGITDENIGYISIASFAATTPRDVSDALKDFDKKNIKNLIIDVRDNPGGELNSLLDTLRLFMPKGDILHIHYKDEAQNVTYKNNKNSSGKYNIVILANENSASAAEAFSASMQDAKVAKIVGKTTFGKGSMQVIQRVITGGAIKLTVALYHSAKGNVVDKVGVSPDYYVRNYTQPLCYNPYILPMQFSTIIDENSSPEEIEAAELRLKLLSIYPGDVDGVFDEDTKAAVKLFQEKFGIAPSGNLDIMTQVELDNRTKDIETEVDKQYYTAVSLLNN